MKTIDRKQAEELLLKSKVSNSELNHNKKEICINLNLLDGKTVLIKYNISAKSKSYYLI
jgi:hypothetical protein